MGVVVKNTLERFLGKLERVNENAPKYFASVVAEKGKEIAQQKYGITPEVETSITVETIIGENGDAQIIASGDGIFYLEYGTGIEGEKSMYPKDKLQFDIDFYSNVLGRQMHLNEWTYSYAHKFVPNIPPVKGHKAYAQMFYTAQELKQLYEKNIKE